MAIKPILFNKQVSAEMVRAILDGRKGCTRRICKDANEYIVPDMDFFDSEKRTYAVHNYADKEHKIKLSIAERSCPICPDDILYVRETWNTYCEGCLSKNLENVLGSTCNHSCGENGNGYYYKATDDKNHVKWRPSIHMPKEAARIWLKVTDVRVERLQEISGEDLIKEGIDLFKSNYVRVAFDEFKNIWNSTIKKSDFNRYGWDANPYVWVISFERCEKPENES